MATGDMYYRIDEHTEYELIEPVHLELGLAVKHLSDYAYTPVITKDVEPINALVVDENGGWWRYWLNPHDYYHSNTEYRIKSAFAGGSHGEIWRGRRKRKGDEPYSKDDLVFKRLKVEHGYRVLEAGLREIYYGQFLAKQTVNVASMYSRYVDHFFKETPDELELWIVFEDAGTSLRSYLYTGTFVGDYLVYQPSELWMRLRMSVSARDVPNDTFGLRLIASSQDSEDARTGEASSVAGRRLMGIVLRQLLEAAAFLHENGIVHRDIKPSNVLCKLNFDQVTFEKKNADEDFVKCILADFSSAWDIHTDSNLYTRGASKAEQTDEYAPPEAIFGKAYQNATTLITPAFDSWSIGILTLELLLGTPNVFTVDQRTRVILTQKMQRDGASEEEIKRALYLAALSQFCIFDPSNEIHQKSLTENEAKLMRSVARNSCTMHDFHQALRARDPLGTGFDSSADTLLRLVWDLLAFYPGDRLSAADALRHPYFQRVGERPPIHMEPGRHNALESLMLDPRLDFNISDSVNEFVCPHCGRAFGDWRSCQTHARVRKHAKFCQYKKDDLPRCLNAHSMLPTHYSSGYCDIQGRRNKFEDFHSIRLLDHGSYYAIFDGHNGNFASKVVAGMLHEVLLSWLDNVDSLTDSVEDWRDRITQIVVKSFREMHKHFLNFVELFPTLPMDKSGTTATAIFMTNKTVIISHIGDSRAILSIQGEGEGYPSAFQLTTDHVASDPKERAAVEARGGYVSTVNGIERVNGQLVISRSIGDKHLASVLSHDPDVSVWTRKEIEDFCGFTATSTLPCFIVLASDGLWDVMSNQEAIDMVTEILEVEEIRAADWRETAALQFAAEALTLEAYVRGSTDNIGVCVVALE